MWLLFIHPISSSSLLYLLAAQWNPFIAREITNQGDIYAVKPRPPLVPQTIWDASSRQSKRRPEELQGAHEINRGDGTHWILIGLQLSPHYYRVISSCEPVVCQRTSSPVCPEVGESSRDSAVCKAGNAFSISFPSCFLLQLSVNLCFFPRQIPHGHC